MGADQSNLAREREYARLVAEREKLRQAQEEQLKERLRSLEAQQLQEAIRRSTIETHSQLYPRLDNPGTSRNETYQTTVPQTLPVNQPHLRFHPSAPPAPVSSAAPRERRQDDSTLCKTCKKPYGDKIFQCKNGHSSCEGCWTLDLPCGICRGPITNIRNFDLENYFTANQRVKCPNAAEGCILSFKKSELPKHERECPFKELKCPALGSCSWKGQISQLSNHFDEDHPTSRQANVDTEMFLPIMCNEYNSLQLIKLGNFNFLFYVKVSEMERKVYMDVQLIGTRATASKWYYEIHVYNKREPRRKYQYNDTCRSSQETPTDISLRNCAVLPLPYAMSFVNEGTITYKFYIKKNSMEKRN